MAKKKKYYVVWKGVDPGIYETWAECQMQIKGYPDAKYKSFKSLEEAQAAFQNAEAIPRVGSKKITAKLAIKDHIIKDSIAVDAACSGNPGVMEYRGVDTVGGFELFRQGPFNSGTNNVGEFLAIVHALALCHKKGLQRKVIYSDSRTAMKWVERKKANTKLAKKRSNVALFQMIERAETWLKKNQYQNQIIKWDTKNWGEIPADFGRK